MTLSPLMQRYDGFIIDLWGVIHDGTNPYPGAVEAIHALHAAGKKLMFLSNAPRRASMATGRLTQFGILPKQYEALITSGEVAFQLLQSGALALGKHYYYLGPGKDENILDGLEGFTATEDIAAADFILNTGYEQDFQPHDAVLPTLEKLRAAQLPLLCVNPDLEVVKQDGTHMLCAGALAKAYAGMGGTVHLIGKPHGEVYAAAKHALKGAKNLLAIGDNPLTDILGANQAGVDSLLLTGGVLSHHHGTISEEQARALCAKDGASPTHVMETLQQAVLG